MLVKEFIELYKNAKVQNTKLNPNAVEEFIRGKLEIREYLPFVEKRALCEKVLDASCETKGAIVEVDSVSRYVLFTLSVLAQYTNLEFGKTDGVDSIDEYDMLCQNGLLNYILATIAGEYEACNNMLNMMMADIDANNNNVAAVFDRALQSGLGYIDNIIDALVDKINDLELDLSQLDIDKIMGIIDKLPKK